MFRLAKVLEWKERLEEEARARRLDAERRAAALEGEAARLRGERRGFPDDLPSGDVAELAGWAKRSELLRRNERSLLVRLEAMQPELTERRAEHLAIRQDVESLRKLRDRQLREAAKRRERRAQEAIDEAAARRFLPPSGRKFRPAT